EDRGDERHDQRDIERGANGSRDRSGSEPAANRRSTRGKTGGELRPDLFTAFGIAFPSYFVLLLTGFFFATAAGVLWARRIGQNGDVIVDLGLAMLLAGVAGGRILHVIADGHFDDYVHLCTDPSLVDWHISRARCLSHDWNGRWDDAAGVCHPTQTDCFAWAKFWAGGLTYYGGFIGASLA